MLSPEHNGPSVHRELYRVLVAYSGLQQQKHKWSALLSLYKGNPQVNEKGKGSFAMSVHHYVTLYTSTYFWTVLNHKDIYLHSLSLFGTMITEACNVNNKDKLIIRHQYQAGKWFWHKSKISTEFYLIWILKKIKRSLYIQPSASARIYLHNLHSLDREVKFISLYVINQSI